MQRRCVPAGTALSLVLVGCSLSSYRDAAPHHVLERTYAFTTKGDTSFIYEGHPAAHIFLIDGLPRAYDRISGTLQGKTGPATPARHAFAPRLVLSPMFRVRQLRDSSAAVRTPSFMPRLFVEGLLASGLGTPDVFGDNVDWPHALLTGVRLSLTHHSNGQAGCFREGDEPIDSRANQCRPTEIDDTTRVLPDDTLRVRLNRANGDFSSTFLSVTAHVTFMGNLRKRDGVPRYQASLALGYDWHPRDQLGVRLPGALTDEQRALYGGHRARGRGELMTTWKPRCALPNKSNAAILVCELRSGRTRITGEGERGPHATGPLAARFHPAIVPWRGSVELSHTTDALHGLGVFARWHDGQDYYNIGFANRHRAFMYGVMLDVGGRDRIAKRD